METKSMTGRIMMRTPLAIAPILLGIAEIELESFRVDKQ
jgi:hypothetical protein